MLPLFKGFPAGAAEEDGALAVPGKVMSRCLKTGGTAKICRRSNLKRIISRGE
jgi:hypothetical protein